MKNMIAPTNVSSLQSLLGIAHHYRNYILNMYTLREPLNKLLKILGWCKNNVVFSHMLFLYMISELIHWNIYIYIYIYSHVIYHFEARFFALLNRVIRYRSLSLHSFFFAGFSTAWTKFRSARFSAETARDINDAFGPGTSNERVAQRWFKEFRIIDIN